MTLPSLTLRTPQSKLWLVDLAGSERATASEGLENEASLAEEGKRINLSLTYAATIPFDALLPACCLLRYCSLGLMCCRSRIRLGIARLLPALLLPKALCVPLSRP